MTLKTVRLHALGLAFGLILFALALAQAPVARAQGPLDNSFTYQGQLKSSGSAYAGTCDFIFNLWDDPSAGSQIGSDNSIASVSVTSGLFTVKLNDTNQFGTTPFNGNKRYLKIQVRCPAGSGVYTTLTPRQELTATPNATNAQRLNGDSGPFVHGAVSPFCGPCFLIDTNDLPVAFRRNGTNFVPWCDSLPGYPPNFNYCVSTYGGVTLSGGGPHTVNGNYASIGGGANNTVGPSATVAGGQSNNASGAYASISGGLSNTANGDYSFVTGRRAKNSNAAHDGVFLFADGNDFDFSSTATNQFRARATGGVQFVTTIDGTGTDVSGWRIEPNVTSPNIVGGYIGNTVTAGKFGAVIGGGGTSGNINQVTDSYGTVGGGYGSSAGSLATVSGGQGNTASGYASAIPGGYLNVASGMFSFAAGNRAKSLHQGSFVFADSQGADFSSTGNNQFLVRATGGVGFYTNLPAQPTTGVVLSPGSGSWSSASDRNAKQNFSAVNARAILARVAALPLETWNYKSQDANIRHIGPMAQDFYTAFNVGEDDKHITTVDADGVALAAIQGLNQVIEAQQAEINSLKILLGAAMFGVIVCLGACVYILRLAKQSMVVKQEAAK